MKIMLVCPECNNTNFRIKQSMGFFKKKVIDINNDNYYMQEVVCTKCHSVYFMELEYRTSKREGGGRINEI